MTARQQSVPPWFGQRIKRERERRGWSQRELARKAGISQATPIRVEAGQDLALSSAIALSSALGLSLDALLAEPVCGVCDGEPPEGFICTGCSRKS
jgi:transcriptional regulator with XRE-family HTH domain